MKRSNAKWLGIGALALAVIVPTVGFAHSTDDGRRDGHSGARTAVVDRHVHSDHSDAWQHYQWYRWRTIFGHPHSSRSTPHPHHRVDMAYDYDRRHYSRHDWKSRKHSKYGGKHDSKHGGKHSNDRHDRRH
ncbi:MAG: hypothetical protein O3A63_18590 [Proteobacteria bacterium]|nr:hypothetical protein [Pseudomonadota bacterium]